uniref:Stringent starvation protein B n=1 Tax=Candidatus Kentrum sp. TC TaxID=2126339 RepID=A0A450YK40_9GAMM|nr:MAG: stringent starvation protein B [Candidatus Kentron sp. TC]VFK41905.1 MAG: stringent starvation protein B [Candidatus Kentron sp. TC]VFK57669.1 MAG: stringent starvation protein B [Candidatus Kentron sp. TC]
MHNSSIPPLIPTRPYLVRAMYEWIIDNDCTPFIVADATAEGARVPETYVNEGKIIFNIAPTAVKNLNLGNEEIVFSARFNGVPTRVSLPTESIQAIYMKENGAGMGFEAGSEPPSAAEEQEDILEAMPKKPPEEEEEPPPTPGKPSRPTLRIVK